MQWDFIDLGAHGRTLTKVVLPGACEMLAFAVTGTGRQARLHPDEAEYLGRSRFREVAPNLFVRAGSTAAEAGLLQVYRRAKVVPLDPARHIAGVLPGEGEDMRALTFSVAADLMAEEFREAADRLKAAVRDGSPAGTLESLRAETEALAAGTQALIRLGKEMLPEADEPGSTPRP